MTGFGRSEVSIEQYAYTIEMKSVNHRYLDLGIKLPRKLSFLEDRMRTAIKNAISRGRLDLYINQQAAEHSNKKVVIDEELCRAYQRSFDSISRDLQIENDLTVALLARLPEVLSVEQQDVDEDQLWKELQSGIETALEKLQHMRRIEGDVLRKDLQERIERLRNLMGSIEGLSPEVSIAYRDRLLKRINDLAGQDFTYDDNRLMTEVAIMAEKSSIDEEIVRFNSHLEQMITTMDQETPVGRKLDFLVQELNREINTIGSKAGDQKIGSLVVDVKSELEKIREQIQNIE